MQEADLASCIKNPKQGTENTIVSASPTGPQNIGGNT